MAWGTTKKSVGLAWAEKKRVEAGARGRNGGARDHYRVGCGRISTYVDLDGKSRREQARRKILEEKEKYQAKGVKR